MPAGSLVPSSYIQPENVAGTLTLVVPDGTEEDPDPEETILYPVSTTRSRQNSHVNSAQATPPSELADPVPPVLSLPPPASRNRIRAAAVQMVFAERTSRAFITPEQVETLQEGAAKALLETLIRWKQAHSTEVLGETG
jgi:uridine phosphorylase